jgi:hypothetical protein
MPMRLDQFGNSPFDRRNDCLFGIVQIHGNAHERPDTLDCIRAKPLERLTTRACCKNITIWQTGHVTMLL